MIKNAKIQKKEVNCYSRHELKTGGGQLISVDVDARGQSRDENVDKIKSVLPIIKSIHIPQTKKTSVIQGAFCSYSRYKIKQHEYAGGQMGYFEALEIKNPPDNRCGFVLNAYNVHLDFRECSVFSEFKDKKTLLNAWKKFWEGNRDLSNFSGFIRTVPCDGLTPWFYAVGDEELMGDFVFPSVFAEHPIYKPFKKFIVRDYDGYASIKTCLGAISWSKNSEYSTEKYEKMNIFWSDGTITDNIHLIEPLNNEKLWISQAIKDFERLLSGDTQVFEIPFLDGKKFVGKVIDSQKNLKGKYNIKVTIEKEGKQKTASGSLDFIPTSDCPTIESRIKSDLLKKGWTLIKIDSCVRKLNEKWQGVF